MKVPVPLVSGALAGRAALASDEVMPMISTALEIKFQLASTALTVTLNGAPAVWVMALPVLPREVPGAAVSPGARTCSFVSVPGLTVIVGLELLGKVGCVTSDAVTEALPAVLGVRLK